MELVMLLIVEELRKIRYDEVLYEGEIMCLYEKFTYEYNLHFLNRKKTLDMLFDSLYNKK